MKIVFLEPVSRGTKQSHYVISLYAFSSQLCEHVFQYLCAIQVIRLCNILYMKLPGGQDGIPQHSGGRGREVSVILRTSRVMKKPCIQKANKQTKIYSKHC